jgi:Trp operon repressor
MLINKKESRKKICKSKAKITRGRNNLQNGRKIFSTIHPIGN